MLLVACDGEYELEPTFCDDWCRATAHCDDNPAGCVSDCELTKAAGACFERQQELLECYQGAEPDDFVCVDRSFQPDTRVKGGVCSEQRDRLFECEAPGIGLCLNSCRAAQQQLLGSTRESEVTIPGGDTKARETADGGVVSCPTLQDPCEAQCWTLFTLARVSLGAAGVSEVGSGGAEGAAAAIACAQQALLSCYPITDDEARDDAEEQEPPSLLESIQRCVGDLPRDR